MPLKFNFDRFQQLEDTELATTPDVEPFSDGGNPLVRHQALVEIRPDEFKRIDLIADGEGLFLFQDGVYIFSLESSEGRTLNRVRELDQLEVVPYSLISKMSLGGF